MNGNRYERSCARCGTEFSAAHPKAKWCSENCRKRQHDDVHRASCRECGARLGPRSGYPNVSKPAPVRCDPCARKLKAEQAEALAARYEALWVAGKTLQEIADEMGLVHRFAAGAVISMYRAEGRDFPYRRSPEAVAAIRAGGARGKAAAKTREAA